MSYQRSVRSLLNAGLIVACLFAGLAGCGERPAPPETADLILRQVRIVDTAAGVSSAPVDVAVREGMIVRIGDLEGWEAVRAINLSENYVLAGLWDLHVHLASNTLVGAGRIEPRDWYIPLSISHGVLGLRDLGSRTDEILALRQVLDEDRARGQPAPRLKVAGQSFSGRQPWGDFDHTLIPGTPEEAEAMAAAQIARGVDFIKTHDFLAPEIYKAITGAASTRGKRVVGHLRPYSGPLDSIGKGQRDFDHLPPELLAYCGPTGAQDTETFYAGWYTGGPGYYERAMAALFEPDGCAALFHEMAAAGASVTPTLSVRAPVSDQLYEAAQVHLTGADRDSCDQARAASLSTPGEDRRAYEHMTSGVIRQLSAAGVLIGTGTDGSPRRCAVPGLILHEELRRLHEAGLSAAQVLDAATRVSARIAGAEQSGRVEEGYLADLVIVASDPLLSLGALDAITGVVAGGMFLDAVDLEKLRAGALEASPD